MTPVEVRLLTEILAELRALRAERNSAQPTRAATATIFLHALRARVQERVFSVAELIEVSKVNDETRAAIIGLVGEVNGRRLGKYFSSIKGFDLGGFVLVSDGADRDGLVWRFRAAGLNSQTHPQH